MSDVSKLKNNTSNLVTTEDTFEQFQACSTNEDNEFITLSDILPAENASAPSDVPSMVDDMFLRTEQISSPDYMPLATQSTIVDTSINKNEKSPSCSNTPCTEQPDDSKSLLNCLPNKTCGKKRGRPPKKIRGRPPKKIGGRRKKPKKFLEYVSAAVGEGVDKTMSTNSSINMQDTSPTTTTQPTVSKRGRVIKNPLNYQCVASGEDLVSRGNIEKNSYKLGKKRNATKTVTPLSEVNNSNDIESPKKQNLTKGGKISRKRGRKKKIQVAEKKDSSDLPHVDFEEIIQNSTVSSQYDDDDDDDADIALSKLKKKVGTVKKIKKQDFTVSKDSTDKVKKYLDSKDTAEKTSNTENPIPSNFAYNVNNVIAETPKVLVESVFDGEPEMKDSIFDEFEINASDHQKKSDHIEEPKQSTTIEEAIQEDMDIEETLQDTVLEETKHIMDGCQKTVEDFAINESYQATDNLSLLIEDGSKRPRRRKVKRTHYEIDSDEDPFANVELSDEDNYSKKGKKGAYYSDDEYVPSEGKNDKASSEDESGLEYIDDEIDFDFRAKKKKSLKKTEIASANKSPGKKGRLRKNSTPIVSSSNASACNSKCTNVDDTLNKSEEECILLPDDPSKKGDYTHNKAFENFLALRMKGTALKIKKVSSKKSSDNIVAPLEIPTIDPNDVKKYVEISSQTDAVTTKSTSAQTNTSCGIKMAQNIVLNSKQSENACEFLKTLLKTTSELGTLMTEKSEEFIEKKINSTYVKDTSRIDYCIKKAFLLFKLAKDNLSTMEENLEKQYEEFLHKNDLSAAIEIEKKLIPKTPVINSDSDCEIVEEVVKEKKPLKAKFNPKTVFLNKELSIKIAKKTQQVNTSSTSKKQINVNGRHAVWINNSIMVKKVNSTQSFLAQDSRNKKPPDYIYVTEDMVKQFFDAYYKKQALVMCQRYTSPQWRCFNKNIEITCNYFIINKSDEANSDCSLNTENFMTTTTTENSTENFLNKQDSIARIIEHNVVKTSPKTLLSLCSAFVQQYLITTKANEIDSLSNLSLKSINIWFQSQCSGSRLKEINYISSIRHDNIFLVLPLKKLCYLKVTELLDNSPPKPKSKIMYIDKAAELQIDTIINETLNIVPVETSKMLTDINSTSLKSLLKLCIEFIQSDIVLKKASKEVNGVCVKNVWHSPNTLHRIAFNITKQVIFGDTCHNITRNSDMAPSKLNQACNAKSLCKLSFNCLVKYINNCKNPNDITLNTMTIDNVNTMSEEAFLNMEEVSGDDSQNFAYSEEDHAFGNDADDFDTRDDEEPVEENNWVSHVQLNELKSCFTTDLNKETVNEDSDNPSEAFNAVHIKQEIVEDNSEYNNGVVDIKKEPTEIQLEMVHIPEDIRTELNIGAKKEMPDYLDNPILVESVEIDRLGNYDVADFESFVRNNKMMHGADKFYDEDPIFSQSGLRVRRQHQPDSDVENDDFDDNDMSLLIPTISEPLMVATAKGTLMESSSDNDENVEKMDKKQERRKRGKPKKIPNSKVVTEKEKQNKAKPIPTDAISVLTRKMREKIKNKEKNNESSDSDNGDMSILKQMKIKESVKEIQTNDKSTKEKAKPSLRNKNTVDDEIQCNNVDSTEQIEEIKKSQQNKDSEFTNFSGFSVDEQLEIDKYRNILSNIYNKILPETPKTVQSQGDTSINNDASRERSNSPLMMTNEPAELLECEPIMPEFYDDTKSSTKIKTKYHDKTISKKIIASAPKENDKEENQVPKFTERHGWQCYPIEVNDTKLYQVPYIALDKLPEEFVETYFHYQQISNKSQEDTEVDRLTNLNSLNRTPIARDGKSQVRNKEKTDGQKEPRSDSGSGATSPHHSDNCNEFAPSDDENVPLEDEMPPPVAKRSSENCLAKNLLMGDNDSDTDTATEPEIKKEPGTEAVFAMNSNKQKSTNKVGNKVTVFANPESLVLTADKMMKKELEMLHAPINLEEVPELKYTPPKESISKPKEKPSSKSSSKRDHVKSDDSSSEEEKQWVSTKEKLLKRMEKRLLDDAMHEDAKRAKIVSEYIEKKVDSATASNRKRGRKVRRKMSKKFLERQKQMRFLNNELYGDQGAHAPGKRSIYYAKGRRNIRKVIDKKSLARSTVVANMEEFERKRRLHMKQNQLRELLGYEEGVNVLVINDEVSLEYDFKELQPVVTVHPFFTKVMKAHQYEGVKFMWDACFESLDMIESGQPGGGCILAHCMGLGKTLQVLALLHTVLTHPRVGMQRVLVCCPLSTVLNWVDEIHKWLGPVTNQIKVFELSKLKKTYERAYQLEDWYTNGGIFIIGYELFRSLTTLDAELDDIRPTIVNKIRSALVDPGPDIIVCDEGHLLKNDASVLAIAMSRVRTRRRIVLTGTPMQNNLREYYCMVNFVKPNLLGTYSEYSNRFENPIMNGQHRDSQEEDIKLMKTRTHILHKVLEGCLQRQEVSVLYPYLPKKHEYTVFISLTKCQSEMYRHYLDEYCNTSKHSVLKDYNMLQKVWSHPRVLHHFQMRRTDEKLIKAERLEDDLAREDLTAEDIKPADTEEAWWLPHLDGGNMLDVLETSNKFVTVFKILKECVDLNDKLLIFSTSLFTMDALEHFLKTINKWSLGQEYYRLDGSVPPEVRQKWCREFNAENNHKTKLFLISTRAGSLGLNMTAANRVIILDTSWNPAHDIQSIFRVYRFGQKKDCYIYRLVAMGTMEQKIYERAVTKQAVSCRVVDEQQIDRHYNSAELTELYSYDLSGTSIASGVAASVRDVALLRVARDARGLHAVHEHDSLLRDTRDQLPEHERDAAWRMFQEEQHTKQVQNQLSYNMIIPPLKSAHDHNYFREPASQAPVDQKPDLKVDPEYTPYQLKSKKGRKTTIKCDIPIQKPDVNPEPPAPIVVEVPTADPNNDILNKIRDALQKHNFNNIDAPLNTAEVAKLVSSIISNVNVNIDIVPPDAKEEPVAEEPIITKKAPESDVINLDSSPVIEKRKKGRPRKYLQETQVITSKRAKRGRPRKSSTTPDDENAKLNTKATTSVPVDSPDNEVKGKRKTAMAAKTYLDNAVINLDDDDDIEETKDKDSDDDYRPEADDNIMDDDVVEETTKELIEHEKQITNNTNDKSIELSDDDGDKTVVPLHTSLLLNKNFIKIVAHTYLKGNPMLDEDAATLAAEYSTSKALKEAESTGKSITSGPIYDIAIQVLGINVLQKLQDADASVKNKFQTSKPGPKVSKLSVVKTSSLIKPVQTSKLEENTPQAAKPLKVEPIKIKVTSAPNSRQQRAMVMSAPPVSKTPILISQLNKPNVVPVGLIKRTCNIPTDYAQINARDECILPDDDDVHIVNTPGPAPPCLVPPPLVPLPPPPAPLPPPVRPLEPLASSSPPTALVNKVSKKKRLNSQNETQKENALKIKKVHLADIPNNAKIIPIHKSSLSTITAAMNIPPTAAPMLPPQPPSPQDNTICLDSDDDEPTVTQTAAITQPTIVQAYMVPQNVAMQQSNTAPQIVPISLHVADQNLGYLSEPTSQMIVPNVVRKVTTVPQRNVINQTQNPVNTQFQPLLQNSNIILIPQNITNTNVTPGVVSVLPINNVQSLDAHAVPSTENIQVSIAVPNTPTVTSNKVRQVRGTLIQEKLPNIPPKVGDTIKFSTRDKVTVPPSIATTSVATPESNKTTTKSSVTLSNTTKINTIAPAKSTSLSNTPVKSVEVTSKNNRARRVSITSSSSSGRSRSSSPNDTLSLFKNVVHIQAPNTQSPPTNVTIKKVAKKSTATLIVKPEKPKAHTKNNAQKVTNKSIDYKANNLRLLGSFDLTDSDSLVKTKGTALSNEKSKSIKYATSITTPSRAKLITSPSKPTPSTSKPTTSTSKPTPSTSKLTSSTSKSILSSKTTPSKSITMVKPAVLPKSITLKDRKTPQSQNSSTSTVIGTSKNIIIGIGGSNKTIAKTAIKPGETGSASNRVVHITNVQTIPAASTKSTTDVKRKSSTVSTHPESKKKKSDRPMRLEDFSLDDIEDIIELE